MKKTLEVDIARLKSVTGKVQLSKLELTALTREKRSDRLEQAERELVRSLFLRAYDAGLIGVKIISPDPMGNVTMEAELIILEPEE